jgi:hypothetical protein
MLYLYLLIVTLLTGCLSSSYSNVINGLLK